MLPRERKRRAHLATEIHRLHHDLRLKVWHLYPARVDPRFAVVVLPRLGRGERTLDMDESLSCALEPLGWGTWERVARGAG